MADLIDARGEFFTKDTADAAFYQIDWAADLGSDTITGTPVWVVPVGITKSDESNTTTTSRLKLAGGTAGTEYGCSCTIATLAGQAFKRIVWVRVTPFPTLATNALIDLDYLKTSMRVYEQQPEASIDNVLLAQKINEASDFIETYCRRIFKAADYVERIQWQRSVNLKQYPIQYVKTIHRSTRSGFLLTNTASGKDYATAWVSGNRKLYLNVAGGASHGLQTVDLTLAANDTLSELLTVINAIGAGWGATLSTGRSGNERSEDLVELSPQMVESTGLVLTLVGLPETCGFKINEAAGILEELSSPYLIYDYRYSDSNAWVKYRAGYDTIPDDLKSAAAMVAKHLFDEAGREGSLQSERIGDYSYTRFASDGGSAAPKSAVPPHILAALDPFASPSH